APGAARARRRRGAALLFAGAPTSDRATADIRSNVRTRAGARRACRRRSMMPDHRSPNLPLLSTTVIGWLTSPTHLALAPSVVGWGWQDWEGARWAVQVHGIGPLLDCAAAR